MAGTSQAPGLVEDAEQVVKLGYKLLYIVYHAQDTVAVQEDPSAPPSLLVEPFLFLPSATDYPDYYQIIKRPLAFEQIREKLAQRGYASFDEVRHDCETICNNAKRYNLKETPIWTRGKVLHSIVKDTYVELVTGEKDLKSSELPSNPPLLDQSPYDVEPLDSRPPSLPREGEEEQTEEQVASEAQTSPSGSKPRRITIKKKPEPAGNEASSSDKTPKQERQGLEGAVPSPVPEVVRPPPVAEQQQQRSLGPPITPGRPLIDSRQRETSQRRLESPPVAMSSSAASADKRRRPHGRGKNLKSSMKQWLNELYDCKRPDGTYASDTFEEQPSREEYPDYYKVITQPISLKEITANVTARNYRSPYFFFTDVRRMLANAKYYNEEGSQVWLDADIVGRLLETKVLPTALEQGFTLDPKDTRSSVLPKHLIEAELALTSGGGSSSTSMSVSPGPTSTRQAAPPANGTPRVIVKLGGRELATSPTEQGQSLPLQTPSQPGPSQQMPRVNGPGHRAFLPPGAQPMLPHQQGYAPHAASPLAPHYPQAASPPMPASSTPIASMRPVRSQHGPSPAHSPPLAGQHGSPYNGRPGQLPNSTGYFPPQQSGVWRHPNQPNGPGGYPGGPPPPPRGPYPGAYPNGAYAGPMAPGQSPGVPMPSAHHREPIDPTAIRRLPGLPTSDPYASYKLPTEAKEEEGLSSPISSSNVASLEDALIPALVLLGPGVRQVLKTKDGRNQSVLTIGRNVENLTLMFRFEEKGEEAAESGQGGDAMDVDQTQSGLPSSDSQVSGLGAQGMTKASSTDSLLKKSPSVTPVHHTFHPRLNNRILPITWTRSSSSAAEAPEAAPNGIVASSPKRRRSTRGEAESTAEPAASPPLVTWTAKLNLSYLQRGSNLFELKATRMQVDEDGIKGEVVKGYRIWLVRS